MIVTSEEWGNPADAVWLSFAQTKDVKLYFVKPQPNEAVMDTAVFAQKWRDQPAQLPRGLPVYYVTRHGDTHAFVARNRTLEDPVEIVNPPGNKGEPAGGVVIYHLR